MPILNLRLSTAPDARQVAWDYGGLTQRFRAVRKALQQP